MKYHFLVKKKKKTKMPVTFWECPWQISEYRKMPVTSARDIFARDIYKTPVTIFKKMPVTSKKWPWQFSKIECHAQKKMSRGKKNTARTHTRPFSAQFTPILIKSKYPMEFLGSLDRGSFTRFLIKYLKIVENQHFDKKKKIACGANTRCAEEIITPYIKKSPRELFVGVGIVHGEGGV